MKEQSHFPIFRMVSLSMVLTFILGYLVGPGIESKIASNINNTLGPHAQDFSVSVKGRDVVIHGQTKQMQPRELISKLKEVPAIAHIDYNVKFSPAESNFITPKTQQQRAPASLPKRSNLASPIFHDQYFFFYKKDTLKPQSKNRLSELHSLIAKKPNALFEIRGFTDDIGPESYNFQLSKKRANALMLELLKMGVDYRNIALYYKGQILDDNKKNRAKNRRVEVSVYSQEDKKRSP